ncbi:MAG: T9SS C-terminal target domain-containing protein [Bacteroidetes bacterium]|nr:MAG: T9SS C-terminal target domain-containing protein [Bacteroidota bacterium]
MGQFCPGNYFDNGDFELGSPPPNASNTIGGAQGWDKIWSGNSEADYYDENHSAIGPLPSPMQGDYGSLWIDNRFYNNDNTWREGLLNQLATTIPQNSGWYSFTFDLACLWSSGNNDPVIGVYGIHAVGPYSYANEPTSSHTPTNLNLFSASGLSHEIVLLGTVPVSQVCDGVWQNHTFSFNSASLGLSGDITHIAITSSDDQIGGASKYIGVDNFCLAITDPPFNCEGLSVSTSSAVEANGECCWDISYDNQQGDVYGIKLTALGGVSLSYAPGSIAPGLTDVLFSGNSVTLIPTIGGPLPTGQLNNFIQFCLSNIENSPQQVLVEWFDENFEVVCDELLEFDCEPVPECLYTSVDTIYCDGADVIYEFTLTNPPSNPVTIGLAKLDVTSPAAIAGVYTQGSLSIPPGGSWSGQIVIPGGYQYAGQDLCYNIYAHEGPEELYCCFDSTLYCIEIPECPPCEDVWVDITPLNMENDSTDCCYRLDVTNNFDDMYFTNLQTTITTPGVTFSDIDFQLPHQWSYTNLVYKKDLMWSHSGGGFIPEVSNDFLMDFCLEGITTTDPVEIIVNWFAQDSVVCSDTLYVECNDCLWIEEETVECTADGNYEYSFSFYNHSGFTVNAVKFVELPGTPDYILEDLVFLGQDYPSHDGQLITVGPITISGSAGPSPPDYCFNLSLRYERPEDSLSIECCHLLHCVELPECDEPIGCSCETLEEDIFGPNCGFDVSIDCYEITIQPLCLQDCDEVTWTDEFGNQVSIPGNLPFTYTVPGPGAYTFLITVSRMDDFGEVCEFQTELVIEVPDCVDPNCIDPSLISDDPCPLVFQPVCGCDNLTYSNECFAMNAGLLSWTPGICPGIVIDDEISVTGNPVDPSPSIRVEWQTLTSEYLAFSILRRIPGAPEWTLLTDVDGGTYETTDPNPNADPTVEYQVIGTTPEGYSVLSNIAVVNLPEPPDVVLYPVPAIQDLIIKVPVEGVYELQILNSNGVQIQKYKDPITAEGPVDLDISMLKPGIYLLRLQHEDGTTYLKKFVVMY